MYILHLSRVYICHTKVGHRLLVGLSIGLLPGTSSVSKSSALSDNFTQQETNPTMNVQPTTEQITLTTNVNAEENNTNQAADAQF
ncbi:hypothetical protein Tco_0658175 [Tanacetum coccineum]